LTHLNKERLMRFLELKLLQYREHKMTIKAEEVVDIMNTISTGKYNSKLHDHIIPSLFFIFYGMVITFIIIGMMLGI
jgi:hypothetical protein